MPSLQLHQLRVAAVAKMVCENSTNDLDTQSVILACLFHDMGNIIKFDLAYFSDFTEPEGLAHWELVKKDYIQKYGPDHHEANVAIAREIGLPESAVRIIGGIGFSKLEKVLADPSFEQKISQYGDLRVGPHGVLAMEKRLEEGRERYGSRKIGFIPTAGVAAPENHFQKLLHSAHELEKQILDGATIAPEDITEAAIAPSIEELREYPIA